MYAAGMAIQSHTVTPLDLRILAPALEEVMRRPRTISPDILERWSSMRASRDRTGIGLTALLKVLSVQ